jgi:hypothetical protein
LYLLEINIFRKAVVLSAMVALAGCATRNLPAPPLSRNDGCGYTTFKGSFVVIDKVVLQPKTFSSVEIADVTFQFHSDGSDVRINKWPAFSMRLYAEVPQIGQSIIGTMTANPHADCPPFFPNLDVEAYPHSLRWVTNTNFTR